jgi:hypothetical protein
MYQEPFQYDLTDAGQYSFPGFEQFVAPVLSPRYRLDDTNLLSMYGINIPLIVADLLDIAASIMWADRQSKRPKAQGKFREQRGWARAFDIKLGVRCYDVWRDPTIKNTLEQILFWLTEDTWQLQFEYQPARRLSDIQHPLFASPDSDALVVLYSGGLDSLAGAIELLHTHPQNMVILISVAPPRLRGILNRQYALLQHYFGSQRVKLSLMPFHLIHENASRKDQEDTQRTRGFLYFVCGLAQAVVFNAHRILMCENGIGILNLPLNKRQLGTQNTRSVHPQTIVALSHLLSLLDLPSIQYEAPFLSKTKGTLCTVLKDTAFQHLCSLTISCDSFAIRRRKLEATDGEWHCGLCTSCLLRRQSLFAAQLQEEDARTSYIADICSPLHQISEKELEPLQMMLDQITLFKYACSSEQPATALLLEFPELQTALYAIGQYPERFGLTSDTDHLNVVVDLIHQYVDEWQHFPYKL